MYTYITGCENINSTRLNTSSCIYTQTQDSATKRWETLIKTLQVICEKKTIKFSYTHEALHVYTLIVSFLINLNHFNHNCSEACERSQNHFNSKCLDRINPIRKNNRKLQIDSPIRRAHTQCSVDNFLPNNLAPRSLTIHIERQITQIKQWKSLK